MDLHDRESLICERDICRHDRIADMLKNEIKISTPDYFLFVSFVP